MQNMNTTPEQHKQASVKGDLAAEVKEKVTSEELAAALQQAAADASELAPPPASNASDEYIEVTGATGPKKNDINGVYKKSTEINGKNKYNKYDLSTKTTSSMYIIFIKNKDQKRNNKWYFTYTDDKEFGPSKEDNNYLAVGDCPNDDLIGCSNWRELIPVPSDSSSTSSTPPYTLEYSSIQIVERTIVEESPKEEMAKLVSDIDERHKVVTTKYGQLTAGSNDVEWGNFEKVLNDAIGDLNYADYKLKKYTPIAASPPNYTEVQDAQVLPVQPTNVPEGYTQHEDSEGNIYYKHKDTGDRQYHPADVPQAGSTASKKNKKSHKSHRSYHPKIGKTRKRHNTHNKPKRISFVHQA